MISTSISSFTMNFLLETKRFATKQFDKKDLQKNFMAPFY